MPDDLRLDTAGNLWTSAQDGVNYFSPDGGLLVKIKVPQTVANLTFGGENKSRIFITVMKSLYSIYVAAAEAHIP